MKEGLLCQFKQHRNWTAAVSVIVAFVFSPGALAAQQSASGAGGPQAPGDIPVEYSNLPDEDFAGFPSPGQVLFTTPPPDGPGLPSNTTLFGGPGCPPIELMEVDALANEYDFLFDEVVGNTAALLVSFEGDPPALDAVHQENPHAGV